MGQPYGNSEEVFEQLQFKYKKPESNHYVQYRLFKLYLLRVKKRSAE
jgi:hypothetical protein